MNVGTTPDFSIWRASRYFAIGSALAVFTASAWTQQNYTVDPASSEVHFMLGAWDGPVNGTFRERRHDRHHHCGCFQWR